MAALLITALSLLVVLAPAAQAGQEPVVLKDKLAQSQIYNGDLEVEQGQVLEGDVTVYSGDVDIKREGRITGALTVYSGDVAIEEGGVVEGDLTSWSGDVQVDGRVDGSISALAGDVEIGDKGRVGGDISAMAGNIKQREGASVGGSILRGPDVKLPLPGAAALHWGDAPVPPAAPRPDRNGWLWGPLGFLGRGLAALLLLALFVGGAAATAALRPAWTAQMQDVLKRQPALAFAAGLIANVLLLAVIGFLYITVCLRPPGLLLGIGMLVLNAAGMAAVGAEIGGRASERMSGQWTPTSRVALGVLIPGAIVAFLWALGGCFGFFGFLGALLLGSFGVGTILIKALNLGAGGGAARSVPAPAPANLPAGENIAEPAILVAPLENAPAEVPPGVSAEGAAATEWWKESAEPLTPKAEIMPAAAPVGSDPGLMPMVQADFTKIEGIGPKLNQRLHAANIHTFADLAALQPETLAGIFGWTAERVVRTGVLKRAADLAE